MCSSKHRGPRPKISGGQLAQQTFFSLSLFLSPTQHFPSANSFRKGSPKSQLCFASPVHYSPSRAIQPEVSSCSPQALAPVYASPLPQAGGPLTDLLLLLLCQAQLQEAKSPSCVPPKLVHGELDETEGSSRLWKRIAGRGAMRVNGTCHWLGAAGQ